MTALAPVAVSVRLPLTSVYPAGNDQVTVPAPEVLGLLMVSWSPAAPVNRGPAWFEKAQDDPLHWRCVELGLAAAVAGDAPTMPAPSRTADEAAMAVSLRRTKTSIRKIFRHIVYVMRTYAVLASREIKPPVAYPNESEAARRHFHRETLRQIPRPAIAEHA